MAEQKAHLSRLLEAFAQIRESQISTVELEDPKSHAGRTAEAIDEIEMRVATNMALLLGKPPPESIEQVKRENASSEILRLEQEFSKHGNPMDAFKAFLLALNNGLPLPGWVLDYLYEAISRYWMMFEAFLDGEREQVDAPKQKNDPARALANAFGVRREQGKNTIWDGHFAETSPDLFGDVVLTLAKKLSREGTTFNISRLLGRFIEKQLPWGPRSMSDASELWQKYESAFPEKAAALRQMPGYQPGGRRRKRLG